MNDPLAAHEMTLAELAEASAIAPRTIRFYIARGLLSGPVKAGRGAVYTAEHLRRLEQIKGLQASGHMLSDIAQELEGVDTKPAPVPAVAWWQHIIAADVVVWTRADASPWRTRQVREAIAELARRLSARDEEERKR